MKKIITAIVFLIIVLSAAVFVLYIYFNRSVSDIDSDVMYTIDKGASIGAIAADLEENEIIRSALFIKIYGRVTGKQSRIRTGTFIIRRNMTSTQIFEVFINGKELLHKFTIPEGYTITQVASVLERERITSAADFIRAANDPVLMKKLGIPSDTVEGYLFPDTYQFPANYPAEKVVSHMVDVFFIKLEEIYPDYILLSSSDLYNKIILASIVEREYRIEEEAPLMASAFYNRIKINHKLESCATVVYIMIEKLGRDNPSFSITLEDTKIDSPYNTYRIPGLPPGPISNPGKVALNAVFYPADTDYMFFRVIDPAIGKHFFSKTYDEHLDAYKFLVKTH